MRYWRFRAYDSAGVIKVGVTHGAEGDAAILRVRQTGLQVFDLQSITRGEYRHFLRNNRQLQRLRTVAQPSRVAPNASKRSMWDKCLALIGGLWIAMAIGTLIGLVCYLLT